MEIAKGTRLKSPDGKTDIRVVNVNGELASVCDLNVDGLDIFYTSSGELLKQLRKKTLEIVEEDALMVDKEALSDKGKAAYERNRKIANIIEEEYGPDFVGLYGKKRKPRIDEITEEFGISRVTFWRIINKYIKSGCRDASLLSNKFVGSEREQYNYNQKTGRPQKYAKDGKALEKTDITNFDIYVKRYLKSPNQTTKEAYYDLIDDCYSEDIMLENGALSRVMFEPENRPSYNQFYYYLKKQTTDTQRTKKKLGSDVYRNDARPLVGSAMDGVMGPGDCVEIDAHEMDVSLVSREHPDWCIGRPVLYLIIDVYTRIILAVSVAFDNNSLVGLTNVFYNLCEDKRELLLEYTNSGFEGTNGYTLEDIWPTNVKPNRIRVDHGSDFISKEFDRILGELNITLDLVPPATGSMKGIVERIFGDIEGKLKSLLENKGGIDPEHRSKHHQQAVLDIDDVRGIIYNYVIYHNTYYMQNYEKSADMIKKRIRPIPCELWRYGCKNLIAPRNLPSKDEFTYALMVPVNVLCTRQGISFAGLKYINVADKQLLADMAHGGKKMGIRYDPRDMGHIYYLKDGVLTTAELSPANPVWSGFRGMSYGNYMTLREEEKKMDAEGKENNIQSDIDLRAKNKNTIKKASSRSGGKTKTKNMRETRAAEKAAVSAEHSIAAKTGRMKASEELKEVIEEKLIPDDSELEEITFDENDTEEERLKKQIEITRRMFEMAEEERVDED